MLDKNFHLIKDLKPFLNNISIQCLIIKYIDDPPDHVNNIVKYHYQIADISGSIILCIPHTLIQEELNKNNIDILSDDIEDVVDSYDDTNLNHNQNEVNINEKKHIYDINKKSSNTKTLKYFFKIGDILNIYGAVTTWSMGKMVLMPNTRIKKNSLHEIRGSIYRVGFFTMNINTEPNLSNLITSTTEKKYQLEENGTNNSNRNFSICKNTDKKNYVGNFLNNDKVSKYDIIPLLNDGDIDLSFKI
ncbi:conserved Plasmodium protein, unknown function [Plasmodium gallinaceum]|uniref:Uncharacterized protein n=1 Tax=Plasmodium gallinaceum TaxID=5849 RepID=A0A1J1GX19_PLAGA|nr:conserved Plasmodium protein, unknown function [Plasmodium gallinaceum]CRG97097.1 conserved Plasmodium protein, unknown function [Plasmodium gallinaceum]